MLEKQIEAHLVQRIKALGGIAYKFTSPQRRSVPDRLVIMPWGVMCFVELKATGQRPTPLQEREHAFLRSMGAVVLVIDSKEQIDQRWPK